MGVEGEKIWRTLYNDTKYYCKAAKSYFRHKFSQFEHIIFKKIDRNMCKQSAFEKKIYNRKCPIRNKVYMI